MYLNLSVINISMVNRKCNATVICMYKINSLKKWASSIKRDARNRLPMKAGLLATATSNIICFHQKFQVKDLACLKKILSSNVDEATINVTYQKRRIRLITEEKCLKPINSNVSSPKHSHLTLPTQLNAHFHIYLGPNYRCKSKEATFAELGPVKGILQLLNAFHLVGKRKAQLY